MLISRQDAAVAGEKRFFTGLPCRKGHVGPRFTSNGKCVSCASAASARWRPKVAGRYAAKDRLRAREWAAKNPDKVRRNWRLWAARHKDELAVIRQRPAQKAQQKARLARYIADNKQRYDAARIAWRRQHPEVGDRYRRRYPEKAAAKAAFERAQKRRATPPWLSVDQRAEMRRVYVAARRQSAKTGIVHHVDHIVPLAGKTVCGLHVPWNLQILSAVENWAKNNSLPSG